MLTPDQRTLLVAESGGGRVTAFDRADDGTLSNRRVYAELSPAPDGPAFAPPDGICLDAEGAVWVANALGSECVRVVEGGGITDRVTTSQRSFACNLGGADLTTLFICTAPTSDADICTATPAAAIEVATVAVPGAGSP